MAATLTREQHDQMCRDAMEAFIKELPDDTGISMTSVAAAENSQEQMMDTVERTK